MQRELLSQVKPARVALLVTTLIGIVMAIVTIAQMAFISNVVNRVFLGKQDLASVQLPLCILLGIILLHALLVWVREVTAQEGALRVKSALRQRLFAHLFQLGPMYCKNEATGELVTTASTGIERLDAYVARYLPQTLLSGFVPLLIAAYILPIDWSSAVLLLVTGPVIPLLMFLVGSYAEKHVQREWLVLSRMSAYFLDAVQGLSTLKLFGRSDAARERITRYSERFREGTLKTLRVAFLSGMVLEFMTAVAIGLIAVTLGVRLLNNDIPFEQAFLILLLAPEFYRPLRELGIQRHAGMEGKIAAERIFEILATPVPVQQNGGEAKAPAQPLEVSFQAISYTYPGSEQPAVQEATLKLAPGSCTALIGRTGSGKSTLVNLLLRFMDAESGQVSVNGLPIEQIPLELWRRQIALVPQRPYLFNESVLENLRMARPNASEQEIEQAAELAGAAEFIHRLPQGYATVLGEQAARLSAGQVQRLAIARAFLKDAPLLILDEPSSSLDPESELLVRQALMRLMQDRTVLVVAHRYTTIASADQIAIMEQGHVVDVGCPETLLQSDGTLTALLERYRKVASLL